MDVLVDQGSGRAVTFLFEEFRESEIPSLLEQGAVRQFGRVLAIAMGAVSGEGVLERAENLLKTLKARDVRSSTLVAIGSTTAVAQEVALMELKFTRSLVLLNPTTGGVASSWEKLVAKVEHYLPLGLPFRRQSTGFDSRPFLHRIRCPVPLVLSGDAGSEERSETAILAAELPTAWTVEIPQAAEFLSHLDIIGDFLQVPAKRPQKALNS